jgi:hypothetical protein
MCPIHASPEVLAIDGGCPVRKTLLPYARQSIDEDDIEAVVAVLRSDWLTTGPKVDEFEHAFAARVGAKYAVTFSSGTAALLASIRVRKPSLRLYLSRRPETALFTRARARSLQMSAPIRLTSIRSA